MKIQRKLYVFIILVMLQGSLFTIGTGQAQMSDSGKVITISAGI